MNYFKNLTEAKIYNHNEFYKENDYVLIKNISTEKAKDYLTRNIAYNIETKHYPLQFGRNHGIGMLNNEFANDYYNRTFDIICSIIEVDFYKTCAFVIEYVNRCKVLLHLDLMCNEASMTACFYADGEYSIYISKKFIENNYNSRYAEFNRK